MRLLAAFSLVLVPGLFAWWTGRALVRRRDDPLLAEQLMARRQRAIVIVSLCAGLAIALAPARALLLYGLAIAAYVVGGFQCRRALYDEDWSFPRYVTGMVRLHAAHFGFWLLLAGAPSLIPAASTWSWPAAAILAAVLIAWSARFAQAFVWITGARPIARADLEARFATVVAATAIQPPRVLRFGFLGGRLVNAFALPSLRQSTVVFTDDVLDQFEPDEVTAIFAHEVAHLEHYDRRRLQRYRVVEWTLAVLACVAVPLAASWRPLAWAAPAWAAAVLLGLTVWRARHKHHEAESDARAAALCGDPAVMARALAKLTALGLWPRRWSADFERSASHPSLARRIQALRAMAGHAVESLAEPVVVASATPGAFVVLDTDRAWWLFGVAKDVPHEAESLRAHAKSSRAIQYSELSELRVSPGLWVQQPALLARTPCRPLLDVRATAGGRGSRAGRAGSGRRSTLRRGDPAAAAARPRSPGRGRGARAGGRDGAVHVIALGVTALVALVRPWRTALTAVAASIVAGLALRLPELVYLDGGARPRVGTVTLLMTLAALVFAWTAATLRKSPEPWTRGVKLTLIALGASALAMTGLGLWEAMAWWPLGLAAVAALSPNAVVAIVALGTALLTRPSRAARASGALGLVLGATAILASGGWLGSPLPEAGPLTKLRWTDARLRLVRHADIDAAADGLRVAPAGRRFALEFDGDDELDRPRRFRVGTFDDTTREITADDLQFLDEHRVLVAMRVGSGTDVSIVDVDGAGTPVSRGFIPRMQDAHLVVDGSQWMALGSEPAARMRVTAFGRLDEGQPTVERWPVPVGVRDAHIVAPGVVFVTRSADRGRSPAGRSWLSSIVRRPIAGTELSRLEPTRSHTVGSRPMHVHCADAFVRPGSLLCQGHSPRSHGGLIWRLDAESNEFPAAVLVPGTKRLSSRAADGRLVALAPPNAALLLDLARGHGVRATLPEDAGRPEEAVLLGDRLAVLTTGQDTSRVALYQLTDPTPATTRR
jgi:Zn-dependent protease with chaperone function